MKAEDVMARHIGIMCHLSIQSIPKERLFAVLGGPYSPLDREAGLAACIRSAAYPLPWEGYSMSMHTNVIRSLAHAGCLQ